MAQATSQTSIMPIVAPIGAAFGKAGVGGVGKLLGKYLFGAISAGSKGKSAVKKSIEIDKKEEKYELSSEGKVYFKGLKMNLQNILLVGKKLGTNVKMNNRKK